MKAVIFIISSIVLFSLSNDLNAQVAISNSSSSPDPSAQLDVSSSEKGILIPRMTGEERNGIISPATGLMIFQTDQIEGFYYFDGTDWIPVGKELIAIDDLLDGIGTPSSIYLGDGSGILNVGVSNQNVALGVASMANNSTGFFNTAVGYRSLHSNSNGSSNVSIGWRALDSNTGGASNVAIGLNTMRLNSTGFGNTASGYSALSHNSNGDYNTVHGYEALSTNQAGDHNSAVGYQSLYFSTGSYNTALGSSSLLSMATGSNNVALGAWADQFNQGGSNNVILGFEAGRQIDNHNASGNVFIGHRAGYNSLGSNKLYIENSDSNAPLIYGEFDNNKVKINGDCEIAGEFTISNYTLPAEDGTTGQVLETDGSGNVSWAYPSQVHYVGEKIGTNGADGIVFWVDHTGEHGLICSAGVLSLVTGIQWYNGSDVLTGASSDYDGATNTGDIIDVQGSGSYAASICAEYSTPNTNPGDWYLPSIQEFRELAGSVYEIYRATNFENFLRLDYWTSTEFSDQTALSCDLDGVTSYTDKATLYRVIAIRAF